MSNLENACENLSAIPKIITRHTGHTHVRFINLNIISLVMDKETAIRPSKEQKETNELMPKDDVTDFLIYSSPDGKVKVEAFLHNETIWLTQKRMAELFDVEVNTINYHLKEIFKTNELNETATIRKIRIVQKEGK